MAYVVKFTMISHKLESHTKYRRYLKALPDGMAAKRDVALACMMRFLVLADQLQGDFAGYTPLEVAEAAGWTDERDKRPREPYAFIRALLQAGIVAAKPSEAGGFTAVALETNGIFSHASLDSPGLNKQGHLGTFGDKWGQMSFEATGIDPASDKGKVAQNHSEGTPLDLDLRLLRERERARAREEKTCQDCGVLVGRMGGGKHFDRCKTCHEKSSAKRKEPPPGTCSTGCGRGKFGAGEHADLCSVHQPSEVEAGGVGNAERRTSAK